MPFWLTRSIDAVAPDLEQIKTAIVFIIIVIYEDSIGWPTGSYIPEKERIVSQWYTYI